TTATAFTGAPAGRPANSARPFSSVFAVRTSDPTWSSTGTFERLFDSCPRMRRTDTVPSGRSVTGRGMPAICFGSGIWNWAAAMPAQRLPRTPRTAASLGLPARPTRAPGVRLPSELLSTGLAVTGIGVVPGPTRRARPRGRRSLVDVHGRRPAPPWALDWTSGEAPRELALDLLAVARAGVQLAHQARRARAQAPRHLLPVGLR